MVAIKSVAHFSIPVSDVAKSTAFYTDIVGCRHLETVARGTMAFLDAAGTCLILVKRDPPINPVPENHGGVHHSFEVLGRKETAEQSFAMLAAGGTATIVGMIPFGQKIELHGFDFLRERRIQGSSMGSNHFRVDMPRLVEFYMRGKLHLEDWISARLKLSEINEGFANMKAGKVVRSVIQFN